MKLWVERAGEKGVRIGGIEPALARCLLELPQILERRDEPRARRRLFPDPTAGEETANRDWQEHVAPELRHLFETAQTTVACDLTQLVPDPKRKRVQQVVFPAEHVRAWMSALNEARLILGELYEVAERDMNTLGLLGGSNKRQAVLRIHLLGALLEQLVALESGAP